MRVAVVTRIYAPEPSSATPTLAAIARAFADRGDCVTVYTTTLPRGMSAPVEPGVRVRRFPVARDRQGYVRGYLPYLTYDLPLAFRLLFSRRPDVYVVEPPPTTGAVVRVVGALQRRPYFYRLADIWSDAAPMATGSRLVVRVLRAVERLALRGAAHLFSVQPTMEKRARELGATSPATTIGWGIDPEVFTFAEGATDHASPYLIYAGTYSEWHGAELLLDAFAEFVTTHPTYRLIFVGNGADREKLQARARELGVDGVEFRRAVPPTELPPLLQGAVCSLASFRPGGYDHAFASKIFASIACGCPTIYAGFGPTRDFIERSAAEAALGEVVDYDVAAVAAAMSRAADAPLDDAGRARLSSWTAERFSVQTIARRFVAQSADPRGATVTDAP